jgi:hypothetical protein
MMQQRGYRWKALNFSLWQRKLVGDLSQEYDILRED